MSLHDILWSNAHQTLTPELIVGILHGLARQPDSALALALAEVKDTYCGYQFQVERLADCLSEIRRHHRQQWDEVERARDRFNPDYESILAAEREGRYLLFTVRQDGELMGNAGCYLYRSLHTQNLCAREDTMYLAREARRGRLAIRFFQFCERCLIGLGVREITVSTKVTNDVHKLWERQGYDWTDRVLTKIVEVDHV